jgi:hypothetical protein
MSRMFRGRRDWVWRYNAIFMYGFWAFFLVMSGLLSDIR